MMHKVTKMKITFFILMFVCGSSLATEYGEIISVSPVLDHVVVVKGNCQYEQQSEGSLLGVAIGSAIGGVVGSRFGQGTGKTIATASGAVAGGIVGNELTKGQNESCRSVKTLEPVPGGYLVVYRYNGNIYKTRTKSIPSGDFIEIEMMPVAKLSD